MRRALIAVLTSCSFAFAAAPASADTRSSVVVRYVDLDLSARGGQDALLIRIENAANRVCGDRSGPMPLNERRASRICKISAEQNAIVELGHAQVAQRFVERGGELPAIVVARR